VLHGDEETTHMEQEA
jgi:hypothetical protein